MKSKLTPQRIAEINREITERFGKSPISSFRCWADDVIARLKNADDRLSFEAILWHNYANPEMVEYRKKHEISFGDIEDELLVVNGQIPTPLNEVQLRWLREWFTNNYDEVATSTQPKPQPNKDNALSIDVERLGSFFNSKFKGKGGNPNHFVDLVNNIQTIKVGKELGMVAVMIFECSYFIKKPSTFAKWFREFFDIIGRECPKENHKNKYQPSDAIARTFYYLS